MKSTAVLKNLSFEAQKKRVTQARMFLLTCMAVTMANPAFAQLTEAEDTANWVLAIFSPAILLTLLTLLLIGCGITVWMGKMSGGLFGKILIGAVLVFGARTLGPKIVGIF